MLTFNIVLGIALLLIVLLSPHVKKYLKRRYDFDFSASSEQNEPEAQANNPPKKPLPNQKKYAHHPINNPSLSHSEETTVAKENATIPPQNSVSERAPVQPSTATSTKPLSQTPAPASLPAKSNKTKTKEAKKEELIEEMTFFILPEIKNDGLSPRTLQGQQVIDVLLNNNTQGEIEFNAPEGRFSHHTRQARKDQVVYNIYKAENPNVNFPDSLDEVKNISTVGLLFNIKFSNLSITPPYAYNMYFRPTAKRVANELGCKIYEQVANEIGGEIYVNSLQEQTDERLEARRKELIKQSKVSIQQKQGSLL